MRTSMPGWALANKGSRWISFSDTWPGVVVSDLATLTLAHVRLRGPQLLEHRTPTAVQAQAVGRAVLQRDEQAPSVQ